MLDFVPVAPNSDSSPLIFKAVHRPFLFRSAFNTMTVTIEKSPYLSMIAKKRPWQATAVGKGQVTDGSEETLFRALSLRHLELPVRELLQQGLNRNLPSTPGVIEALEHNQKDEERHDEALNYVALAHGVDDKSEKEVFNILKAWQEHPAHPILKAAILERSIFFVILPFFRFNGDIGMRTVSRDISRDEQVHVGVHSLVSRELGEGASESLNKLRRATAMWTFDALGSSSNKWLDKDFWIRQSDNLFEKGKTDELRESRASSMPAFFEGANYDLPSYGTQSLA